MPVQYEGHVKCCNMSNMICYMWVTPRSGQVRSGRLRSVKIHQRGVQWKHGVVIYMMLYTSLLYHTTPIRCTPLPLHPPVMNTREVPSSGARRPARDAGALVVIITIATIILITLLIIMQSYYQTCYYYYYYYWCNYSYHYYYYYCYYCYCHYCYRNIIIIIFIITTTIIINIIIISSLGRIGTYSILYHSTV